MVFLPPRPGSWIFFVGYLPGRENHFTQSRGGAKGEKMFFIAPWRLCEKKLFHAKTPGRKGREDAFLSAAKTQTLTFSVFELPDNLHHFFFAIARHHT
ncbi:MAG: hypothetical protein ACOYOO_15160, partial [Saprospiraceae bacterium]